MPRTAGAADQLASTDLSDTANLARTNAGNTFTAGTQDFHAAAHTLPAVTGATAAKPSTCTTGELYFATDATAGQNWYSCTATNTWTQQQTGGLSNPMTTPGDLIVGGASGVPSRLAAPSNGTWCPNWSNGTVTWTTCSGSGSGNTENSFTNQTTLSISNPYATQAVLIQFFDTSSPPQAIEPNTLQVASTSPYGITATFANPQSGYYVINGAGGGSGSGSGSGGEAATLASFDGGGAALNGTITRCRNLKSSLSPTQWTAVGDQSGSVTLNAAYVPYSTYQTQSNAPAYVIASGTSILSGSVSTANSAQGTIASVTIPAGSVICTQISSESNFTWLSLEVAQ
jgi:hypothetical protein